MMANNMDDGSRVEQFGCCTAERVARQLGTPTCAENSDFEGRQRSCFRTNRRRPIEMFRSSSNDLNLMRRTNDGTGGDANALEFGVGMVDVAVKTAL
jgi:hypothetical protein